jgi:hypothetical protein
MRFPVYVLVAAALSLGVPDALAAEYAAREAAPQCGACGRRGGPLLEGAAAAAAGPAAAVSVLQELERKRRADEAARDAVEDVRDELGVSRVSSVRRTAWAGLG